MVREVYSRFSRPKIDIAYAWNTQNRLTEIRYSYTSRPGSLPSLPDNTLQFAYDDNGNRVRKTVNGENSYYINDGLTVLNELDSSGNVIKSIIKGLGQIAEIDASGITKYFHTDVLGSTVLITDNTGAVAQEYEYDPFGELIGSVGMENNRYLFTGQEFDEESELYYYNARYYNPSLGRFISRDPVSGRDGDSLSRNGYVYVKNNPLKYTDPTGEEEEAIQTIAELERTALTIEQGESWIYGEGGILDTYLRSRNIDLAFSELNACVLCYNEPIIDPKYVDIDLFTNEELLENRQTIHRNAQEGMMGMMGATGGIGKVGRLSKFKKIPKRQILSGGANFGNVLPNVAQKFEMIQPRLSTNFNKAGNFSGSKVSTIIEKLQNGILSPNDLPVGYVQIEGRNIIVNNRSFSAVRATGMAPKMIDLSNRKWAYDLAKRLLKESGDIVFDYYIKQ